MTTRVAHGATHLAIGWHGVRRSAASGDAALLGITEREAAHPQVRPVVARGVAHPQVRQAAASPDAARPTPIVGQSLQNDLSIPLKDQPPARDQARPNLAHLGYVINKVLPNKHPDAKQLEEIKAQGDNVYDSYFAQQTDTALQTEVRPPQMPSTSSNFDGVNNVNKVAPSDASGDIGFDPTTGKKFYFQWVNLSYAAWDVTNPALPIQVLPPSNGNTLWQGFGGDCETRNDGDPVVLWDQFARRWFVTQFAVRGPFIQCVAVSATPNPAGAWHRYAFQLSTVKFNDYAKVGIWPDGYYASINQFVGNDWAGAAAVVFDRAKMIQGLPASFVLFDLEPINRAFGGMLPADADGDTLPPAGTPGYFVEVDDNASAPELGPTDALRLWKFKVNWANPTSSTFGDFGNPDVTLPVAPFNALPCVATGARSCIPLPGGSGVDGVADRLMHRAAYRNFGDHESLVLNHTVNVGDGRAGVRWYEVRNLSSSPVIFQQGTFAPNDGHNRWMASLAQDRVGNITLGYSIASSSLSPGIRYTGRLVGDPPGQMTQGEGVLIAGSGYQSGSSRWGDYSSMNIDPTDDCTLWYTSQYFADISSNGWRTRIGAFKFANCAASPLGALRGTLRDAITTLPIADGRVEAVSSAPSLFASSNVSGGFGLPPLPGSYTLNASRYGYLPTSGGPYNITANTTTTADLYLNPAPSHIISGVVSDANSGQSLSATVSVIGFPHMPPQNATTTDASGFYSLTVAEGQSYTVTASALIHAERSSALGQLATDQTRSFALVPITTTGAIVGLVQDLYTGQPISGASVSMSGSSVSLSTLSAFNGAFQLTGLLTGSYSVTAAMPGFSSTTAANIAVSAGGLAVQRLALARPRISISPSAVTKTLVFGDSVTDAAGLVISSSGASPISYTLRQVAGGGNATSGGPDAYGYTWRNSLQNGGAVYSWIDATNGTALNLPDDFENNVTLPFAFPFYGQVITQARIGDNGAVVLNNAAADISSSNQPLAGAPMNMLAPFWDDLDGSSGNVFWATVGAAPNRQFVIEWFQRPHFSNIGAVTFQAVLYEDGDVQFQYQDTAFDAIEFDKGKSASVGIHGPDSASFLQVAFNQDVLQDGLAICFDNPRSTTECGRTAFNLSWLTATPLTREVASGSAQDTALVWRSNSSDTPQPGIYAANIVVRSNDPLASVLFVPLTLTVVPSSSQGVLAGVVQSSGACDAQVAPLASAAVRIQNAGGFSATVQADASGNFLYYLEPGNYDVTTFAQDHITQTVAVALSAGLTTTQNVLLRLDKPCIGVTPSRISETVAFLSNVTVPLTITGSGAQPLRVVAIEAPRYGEVLGADAAGYVLVSDVAQGFVDISASGTFTTPSDDGAFNITTTFPISLYGKSFNKLRIGNNGALLFDAITGTIGFANSPMQTASNYFIAPLWDDFSSEQGGVYVKELGSAPNRMLVVQWQNRPRYKAIGSATFEVILREAGQVLFVYKNVTFGNTFFDYGANATVGIRGANSGQSLQYSFNAPKLQNNFAVCITPMLLPCADVFWVTMTPTQASGLVGNLPTTVLLDSLGSGAGTHAMTLTLVSNATTALTYVPVTLTVTGGRVYYGSLIHK